MRYDRLVVATGAKPVRPDLPGSKHEGVFVLHKELTLVKTRVAEQLFDYRCLFPGGEHQLGPRQDHALLPIASGEKSDRFDDGRHPLGLVCLS